METEKHTRQAVGGIIITTICLFLPPLPDYAWGWVRKVCRRRAGWDALFNPDQPEAELIPTPNPDFRNHLTFPYNL